MINFNASLLNKILSDLSEISNVSFTLYNDKFIATEIYSEDRNCPFCSLIKKYHKPLCMESDFKSLQELKDSTSEHFHYYCHFGLIEIALTLHFNDSKLGYILIGPFRDPEKYETDVAKISEFCQVHQQNEEEMLNLYTEIEIFTEKRYKSLKSLCLMMFQYVCNQNLLIFNENIFFAKILPYIHRHIHEKISIADLCHRFFLSEKQLNKLFVKETGKSPKKYILNQRLIKAQALLTSTSYSLAEIASLVGFNDYNYFIKVFKSFLGQTPINYRKENSLPPPHTQKNSGR